MCSLILFLFKTMCISLHQYIYLSLCKFVWVCMYIYVYLHEVLSKTMFTKQVVRLEVIFAVLFVLL